MRKPDTTKPTHKRQKRSSDDLIPPLEALSVSQIGLYQSMDSYLVAVDGDLTKRLPFPRLRWEGHTQSDCIIKIHFFESSLVRQGDNLTRKAVGTIHKDAFCLVKERQFIGRRIQPLIVDMRAAAATAPAPRLTRLMVTIFQRGTLLAAGFSMEFFLFPTREVMLQKRTQDYRERLQKGAKTGREAILDRKRMELEDVKKTFFSTLTEDEKKVFAKEYSEWIARGKEKAMAQRQNMVNKMQSVTT
ncbi:hypothetical protein PROFUN_07250 [Planoprotostelium fungivorum]|uniref:Uncharacterized protein n=1 Tax=Planoprotostelium fungivorum TaxID=1890364 RepID=A0A2P6NM68_9EUKA|nr:hypothetical protein PROFUN_07250 [Planoprotostelium fungivorum]